MNIFKPTPLRHILTSALTAGTIGTIAACQMPLRGEAQEFAPGWRETGYWQCGPIRVTTSLPVNNSIAMDFYITGTYLGGGHFTWIRDMLYFNGVPCFGVNYPWPTSPPRRMSEQ